VKFITAFIALAALAWSAAPLSAEESSGQPLTREACEKASMQWNDSTNVCGPSGSSASEAEPQATAAGETSGQPLTRDACEKASMQWNDNTNVCGPSSGPTAAASSPPSTAAGEASGQPLTRDACEKASMEWNDSANACGVASAAPTVAVPRAPVPKAMPADDAMKPAKTEKKKKLKRSVKKKLKKGDELNKRERGFILRRLFQKPPEAKKPEATKPKPETKKQ
jgi:hypothetical protein